MWTIWRAHGGPTQKICTRGKCHCTILFRSRVIWYSSVPLQFTGSRLLWVDMYCNILLYSVGQNSSAQRNVAGGIVFLSCSSVCASQTWCRAEYLTHFHKTYRVCQKKWHPCQLCQYNVIQTKRHRIFTLFKQFQHSLLLIHRVMCSNVSTLQLYNPSKTTTPFVNAAVSEAMW